MSEPLSAEQLPALLEQGLRMVAERRRASPAASIYPSIHNQLEYLHGLVEAGERPTEENRASLTLGVYAAREFEASDPDFADVLFKVSYLANRL
jgi:hypothetical protein